MCAGVAGCVLELFCACVHTGRVCVLTRVCTGARPCRQFGKAPVDPCGGTLCVSLEGVWLSTAPVLAWQDSGSAGLCPGTSCTLALLG